MKIRLKNVKAFVDSGDVELAPITIFVGQNSCGKSSFLRFPVVINQTLRGLRKSLVLHSNGVNAIDYGNYEDILHNHEGSTFSVVFSDSIGNVSISDESEKHSFYERKEVECEYAFSQAPKSHATIITECKLKLDGTDYCIISKNPITDEYTYKQIKTFEYGKLVEKGFEIRIGCELTPFSLVVYEYDAIKNLLFSLFPAFTFYESDAVENLVAYILDEYTEEDINIYGPEGLGMNVYPIEHITKEEKETVKDHWDTICLTVKIISTLNDKINKTFGNVKYIGPFRTNPERIYRRSDNDISSVGVAGENVSNMLISSAMGRKIIINKVSDWLNNSFGYSLSIVHLGNEYYQIKLVNNNDQVSMNIMDVGYGVSQILPILIQITESMLQEELNDYIELPFGDKKSGRVETFIIEQPELHLHPAAQSKLAALFAEAVTFDPRNQTIMLIETHSEHLIRALQILIADPDNDITNDMIKFYYVDKTENGSVIKEMKTNEKGQFLERWPKGFFDEAHVMSRKLMDTLAKREESVGGYE